MIRLVDISQVMTCFVFATLLLLLLFVINLGLVARTASNVELHATDDVPFAIMFGGVRDIIHR